MRPLAALELDSKICAFSVELGLINGVLGANRYQLGRFIRQVGLASERRWGLRADCAEVYLLRERGQKTCTEGWLGRALIT